MYVDDKPTSGDTVDNEAFEGARQTRRRRTRRSGTSGMGTAEPVDVLDHVHPFRLASFARHRHQSDPPTAISATNSVNPLQYMPHLDGPRVLAPDQTYSSTSRSLYPLVFRVSRRGDRPIPIPGDRPPASCDQSATHGRADPAVSNHTGIFPPSRHWLW